MRRTDNRSDWLKQLGKAKKKQADKKRCRCIARLVQDKDKSTCSYCKGTIIWHKQ